MDAFEGSMHITSMYGTSESLSFCCSFVVLDEGVIRFTLAGT